MKDSPEKIANFQMLSPSLKERLLPKKRVSMPQMMSGIRVPTMACGIAAKTPI